MQRIDWGPKLNYVIKFFSDACDAPFQVYLQCAFPALLRAIVTYYAIDMVQIFTGWVRPHAALKGPRTRGHGRGRDRKSRPKTWLKRWNRFKDFDPWDSLGRKLPLAEDLASRNVTPGVRHLWTFYDLQQRFAYWMMVYEITEQFFYDWMSGVAKSEYCQQQLTPWCFCVNPLDGASGVLGTNPAVIGEVVKQRWIIYADGNGISVRGKGSSATFSALCSTWGGDKPPPGCYIQVRHESGVIGKSGEMTTSPQMLSCGAGAGVEGIWFFEAIATTSYWMENSEKCVIGNPLDYDEI